MTGLPVDTHLMVVARNGNYLPAAIVELGAHVDTADGSIGSVGHFVNPSKKRR
jgi:hypothetical protein